MCYLQFLFIASMHMIYVYDQNMLVPFCPGVLVTLLLMLLTYPGVILETEGNI